MGTYGTMLVGGLINGGLGLINNSIAQEREDHAREENYRLNEMAAENAQKRTENFYNQYQSPEALLRQYKEAGLSPSLMFSGGASGASPAHIAQGNGTSGISPTSYGLNMLEGAQIAAIQAQTEKTKAETQTIQGENERGQAEIGKMLAEKGYQQTATAYTELQNEMQKIQNDIANATKGDQIKKIAHDAEYAEYLAAVTYYKGEREALQYDFEEETYKTRMETAKNELIKLNEQILSIATNTQLTEMQQTQLTETINIAWQEIMLKAQEITIQDTAEKRKWKEMQLAARQFVDKLYQEYGKMKINIYDIETNKEIEYKKMMVNLISSLLGGGTMAAATKRL